MSGTHCVIAYTRDDDDRPNVASPAANFFADWEFAVSSAKPSSNPNNVRLKLSKSEAEMFLSPGRLAPGTTLSELK